MNFWSSRNIHIAYAILHTASCKSVAEQYGISTSRVSHISKVILSLAGNRAGIEITSIKDARDNFDAIAKILEKDMI